MPNYCMLETQKQSHTVRNTVCGHYWVRMRPREKELRTKKKHIINFQRFLCTYAINFEPSVIWLLDNERIAVVMSLFWSVKRTKFCRLHRGTGRRTAHNWLSKNINARLTSRDSYWAQSLCEQLKEHIRQESPDRLHSLFEPEQKTLQVRKMIIIIIFF